MPAPFSDLSFSRAHARRPRRRSQRSMAVIVVLVLVVALAYGGYRGGLAVWHHLHHQETASSHKVSAAQLGSLHAVTRATADDPFPHHEPRAGGIAPTPAAQPDTAILEAPYTVQAPFGNWKVHEESCEEAALLMYHQFLLGDHRTDIPPAEADGALRALKSWQVQNWGSEQDLTIERTGQLASAYWGHHYSVVPATVEDIRLAISQGHPVIVPVMTRSLDNPHYGPKTVYHEVLLKGYNSDGVIANDAGVQEGKNWFYSWKVLFGAIDAQTPHLNQGRVALVLTA